jgi:hypothetical protein
MKGVKRFQVAGFVIGLALSALVVDLGLRTIESTPLWHLLPVVEPILGQPDRQFGYEFTPGARGVWPKEHRARVHIDSLGLRDVERSEANPRGAIRIGLLGDSMTEAMQVSQRTTFGAIVERELRSRGDNIEVINLAMAGPSPIRQLLRLEGHGYALGLDLAVANSSADSFVSGLLLDDSENPAYIQSSDGGLLRGYGFRSRLSQHYADTWIGRGFVLLYQHSPLFRMLYLDTKEPWRQVLGVQVTQQSNPQGSGQTQPDPVVECRAVLAALAPQLALWRDHQPPLYWQATAHFLDEFANGTSSHAIRVLYAIRDIALPPRDCAAAERDRAELVAVMANEFTVRNMQFVDWSSAVAAIAGPNLGRLRGFGVHQGGGHLNYDGHRAWAAALLGILAHGGI